MNPIKAARMSSDILSSIFHQLILARNRFAKVFTSHNFWPKGKLKILIGQNFWNLDLMFSYKLLQLEGEKLMSSGRSGYRKLYLNKGGRTEQNNKELNRNINRTAMLTQISRFLRVGWYVLVLTPIYRTKLSIRFYFNHCYYTYNFESSNAFFLFKGSKIHNMSLLLSSKYFMESWSSKIIFDICPHLNG